VRHAERELPRRDADAGTPSTVLAPDLARLFLRARALGPLNSRFIQAVILPPPPLPGGGSDARAQRERRPGQRLTAMDLFRRTGRHVISPANLSGRRRLRLREGDERCGIDESHAIRR
jgi:hypothetical protein